MPFSVVGFHRGEQLLGLSSAQDRPAPVVHCTAFMWETWDHPSLRDMAGEDWWQILS